MTGKKDLFKSDLQTVYAPTHFPFSLWTRDRFGPPEKKIDLDQKHPVSIFLTWRRENAGKTCLKQRAGCFSE